MSTAKVASDADKPDGLVVVPPGSVEAFLAPLPTAEIHGVGPVTERTLAGMGIETAGNLAAADPDRLADELGDRGVELYRRARGDDDRAVTPTGLPKSLSRESSLSATADGETKREAVTALAADVARRARERGCLYRTIGIKAVEPPFDVNTRAQSLSGPVDDPDLVESVALDLLDEFDGDRVRKLGVRVSNLDFAESDQATLTGFDEGGGAGDSGGSGGSERGDDETGRGGDRSVDADGATLADWVGGDPEVDDESVSGPSVGAATGRRRSATGRDRPDRSRLDRNPVRWDVLLGRCPRSQAHGRSRVGDARHGHRLRLPRLRRAAR